MESVTPANETQVDPLFTTASDAQIIELQGVHPPVNSPFSPLIATLESPVEAFSPPVHVQPPLHPAILRIQKDGIAGIFLTYQLPATVLASLFSPISGDPARYESTTAIMLGLLSLVLVALIAGNILRDERPAIAAASELVGISLGLAAFVYPISVLFGGTILCYVPPIFGAVVAVMYTYRLATASSHND